MEFKICPLNHWIRRNNLVDDLQESWLSRYSILLKILSSKDRAG